MNAFWLFLDHLSWAEYYLFLTTELMGIGICFMLLDMYLTTRGKK